MLQRSVKTVRRAVEWLVRSLIAALVTAVPDPPVPPSRTPRFRAFRRIDLFTAADVVLAVILYASLAPQLIAQNNAVGTPYPPQFLHLIAAATVSPLLVRRRWPLAAWRSALLLLLWTTAPVQALLQTTITAGGTVVYLLCLYSLASRSRQEVAIGAWVTSVGAFWVTELLRGAGTLADPAAVLGGVVLVTIPLLFGYNVRARRQAQRQLAVQQRRSEEEQAARAVLEERSRIARELHDVVAHHMSVIAIQAEAAPLQVPDAPDVLKTYFAEIRATALEALAETRRVLGVLRDPDGQRHTAPQPGLERLDDLIANARTGGLTVTASMNGAPRPLPPGLELSAYRIVQESLSNAMRHAPGSAVDVEISYEERPPALVVRIENGPPARRAIDTGNGARHGLVGMRERASMLRGELIAGPTQGGGYAVVATLPLEDR